MQYVLGRDGLQEAKAVGLNAETAREIQRGVPASAAARQTPAACGCIRCRAEHVQFARQHAEGVEIPHKLRHCFCGTLRMYCCPALPCKISAGRCARVSGTRWS